MLPSLTPDEAALVERAKIFARDIVMPNAARWERERRMPLEALQAAAALGLTRIEIAPAGRRARHELLRQAARRRGVGACLHGVRVQPGQYPQLRLRISISPNPSIARAICRR